MQQDILQKRREEKAFKKAMHDCKMYTRVMIMIAGRSEKAQVLGGKNREAVREEEEFAVSASKDGIHERTGEKRERKRTLGVKSKKQQYKVSSSFKAPPINYPPGQEIWIWRQKAWS